MKLAFFDNYKLGVVVGDTIVDVSAVAKGIPALMWTDTAEFRNPNYHRPTDTPETLDYLFMAEVAKLLAHVVLSYPDTSALANELRIIGALVSCCAACVSCAASARTSPSSKPTRSTCGCNDAISNPYTATALSSRIFCTSVSVTPGVATRLATSLIVRSKIDSYCG